MTSTIQTPPATRSAPSLRDRIVAEAIGTYALVFVVIGAALFATSFGDGLGIGFLGVSLVAGLVFIAIAYAYGPVSGAHLNPAVTVGLAIAGRTQWATVPGYIAGQVAGALLATATLAVLAWSGPAGLFDALSHGGFASAGWGELSPGGFGILPAFLTEVIVTAVFVAVIVRATSEEARTEFAPLTIGLALAALLLVAIPISNGSLNPARAIATALFGGPLALGQVWLGVIAPLLGGVLAGLFARTRR